MSVYVDLYTVDNDMLLSGLETDVGVKGTALSWLMSYLFSFRYILSQSSLQAIATIEAL